MTGLRVGLVGAGAMGGLHARIVSSSPDSTLMWIADPNRAIAEPIAATWDARWIPEPDLDSVDALVIVAPTQFHYELGMSAIEAGKPLLIEKPLADTRDHVAALIDASRLHGVPLMCGFLERYNPAVRTAFEITVEPLHVSAIRHSPYVERIRTGVASDLLIHDVDLAVRLFGSEPVSIDGHIGFHHPSSLPASEDTSDVTMKFVGGQIATVSASRISQRKVRTLMIAELGRLIEVDLLRQDITIYKHIESELPNDGESRGYRQQSIMEIPVLRHRGEPLALQWEQFLGLAAGTVDAEVERQGLIGPHNVVFAARDGLAR